MDDLVKFILFWGIVVVIAIAGYHSGGVAKEAELVKICMENNPKMAHTEVKQYCREYLGIKK